MQLNTRETARLDVGNGSTIHSTGEVLRIAIRLPHNNTIVGRHLRM
jgi:hypothetical protein